MKCEQCESENITDGKLQGYAGVVFVEKGTEHRLRPNAFKTECKCCMDCGHIFDLRIVLKEK